MSEYNIQMNKYNALNVEYDQLYPATKIENVDGLNTALQKKADLGADGKVPGSQVDAYSKADSISAETRTALSLAETATPDAALAEIARQLSESGNVKMELAWVNASQLSSFAAQDISIPTGYDMVAVFTPSKGYLDFFLKDLSGTMDYPHVSSGDSSAKFLYRPVNFTDGKVTFGDSKLIRAGTVSTQNAYMIPTRIYGIKGIA